MRDPIAFDVPSYFSGASLIQLNESLMELKRLSPLACYVIFCLIAVGGSRAACGSLGK
jgi:hypothetical protein